MSKTLSKSDTSKILSAVASEKGFYFCTAEGVYTGISAISLEDFAYRLDDIDESSILFHYPRGDFQAWIRDTVGDSELADKMFFIQRNISGQQLRLELLKMVQLRISELKAPKKEVLPSEVCNKEGLCQS